MSSNKEDVFTSIKSIRLHQYDRISFEGWQDVHLVFAHKKGYRGVLVGIIVVPPMVNGKMEAMKDNAGTITQDLAEVEKLHKLNDSAYADLLLAMIPRSKAFHIIIQAKDPKEFPYGNARLAWVQL